MPTYADLSRAINAHLFATGEEIAGIPIPLPGQRLVVEDRHPARKLLADLQAAVDGDREPSLHVCRDEDLFDYQHVNQWYSEPERCWHVVARVNGKTRIYRDRHDNGAKVGMLLDTMRAADAWTLEAEANAWDRLETLLAPHLFKAYMLTGTFLETSTRSGLTYIFRRLRPTLAITYHGTWNGGGHLLCALCLHPVAYYDGSWAGGLCPTDDVIAHLLLMRADEHLFWKRANQHQPTQPGAGL